MKHRPVTAAVLTGTAAIAGAAAAAGCPEGHRSGPATFQTGFGAGGTDAIARSLATAIEEQQDRTGVVENQPGAGGDVSAPSRC